TLSAGSGQVVHGHGFSHLALNVPCYYRVHRSPAGVRLVFSDTSPRCLERAYHEAFFGRLSCRGLLAVVIFPARWQLVLEIGHRLSVFNPRKALPNGHQIDAVGHEADAPIAE